MSFRNTTLATAVLLGLGLNAAAIEDAVAGDGCTRMSAKQGAHGDGYHSMAGSEGHGNGAYHSPMMIPGMQPAIYWGT